MKNKVLPIISIVILIAAAGFFLYPTVSVWINQMLSDSTITQYNNTVDTLPQEEKSELLAQAREYNREVSNVFSDSFDADAYMTDERYNSILNVTEDGQIGTVSIPSIDCNLPVYHGSNKEMLNKGAVHMAFTSFPIGGDSSHSVISAHTAYPGKVFFDRLTEIELGDRFSVTVLGETLNYKVVEINVVLPSETQLFEVQKGRDLVTLVTCTPYSVNTHRLLVTGERDDSSMIYTVPPETKHFVTGLRVLWCAVPLAAVLIAVIIIVIGLFVGGFIGVVVMCLMAVAGDSNKHNH